MQHKFYSKISVISIGLATLIAGPAYATADPTQTSAPQFSVSGSTLSLIQNAAWSDGSTVTITANSFKQQAYACIQSIPSAGSSFVSVGQENQILNWRQCAALATTSNGATPFTNGDLRTAYRDNAGSYVLFAESRNITIVTSVVGSNNSVYYAYEPTQSYTYTPPVPTVSGTLGLSISGNIATISPETWSSGTQDFALYGCGGGSVAAQTTVTTTSLTGCNRLSFQSQVGLTRDLSTATLGGMPYNYTVSGDELVLVSDVFLNSTSYYVWTAPQTYNPGQNNPNNPNNLGPAAPPYTGPVLQAPGAVSAVAQGSKVVIPGSNLSGVSKVEIGGVDAKVVLNSAGELEITVPTGLAAGTYDLVVTSDSGKLTVQDGIRVSGSSVGSSTGSAKPSSKRIEDNTAKVWVFDVVGAGKVQILVNGTEIAWVRATEASDSKLTNGYLVRTVNLQPGKNVIEVLVDGERVRRTVYSN